MTQTFRRRVARATLLLFLCGCTSPAAVRPRAVDPGKRVVPPTIDDLQRRTFQWFWDTTNPQNGLVPDRWPTKSFSSVAAVGFGLTAYAVGVERGWVSREAARDRVLTTLRFFWNAPQGTASTATSGHRGFFYHFLDMNTGHRFERVELSSIDTSLLIAGALFCQSYFDRDDPAEREIRELAENLYRRVEWNFYQVHSPAITMAWFPERGFERAEYRGYNEAHLLYILALGSPTHPVSQNAWTEWTKTIRWGEFYGYEHANFAPLFGHQYSHVWIDFRGIQDDYMRGKGIDYFENSRRATLAQRAYAIDNPNRFQGHSANIWGLTACDGPVDARLEVGGRTVQFWTYRARGAALGEITDDGTIAPTAAAGSIAFTPQESIAAIEAMMARYGTHLYQQYGFLDAFNDTLERTDVKLQHGRVVPGVGWFDNDYLGIDQGPILAMIENYRTGLVWNYMRRSP
ncbi:MAG TPA: glucoamylase family protein, partial [Thermoanaerobaculia bacterium]